jgi:hypothetical protein
MLRALRVLVPVLLLVALTAVAKEPQPLVIMWPASGTAVLQISFSKFKDLGGSVGSQRPYVTDATVLNLSTRIVAKQHFTVYLFDKKQVRIGEAWMDVTNLGPSQTVKFQVSVMASGTPVSVQLLASSDVQKAVSMTINSVPQGALLKVDGIEAGTTPKLINVGPGKHLLTFSKGGFRAGEFPLEIGPNDVSGGSVSYELGAAQFDTVELRDGTVLNGDLDSIRGMDVVVRVGGELQRIDRNKIKRILLTEREAPDPSSLPPAQPQ